MEQHEGSRKLLTQAGKRHTEKKFGLIEGEQSFDNASCVAT